MKKKSIIELPDDAGEIVTEQKQADRSGMLLGQKLALLLLPAIRGGTEGLDGRTKVVFWNGVMAEIVASACQDLGTDMATVMFNHISSTLMPKLVAKITGRPPEPASSIAKPN